MLAAAIGAIGGLWVTPSLQARAVIRDITADEASARLAAWDWLTSAPLGTRTIRLETWQEDVETQLLLYAQAEALLDAAAILEAQGRLSWEQSPPELMNRVIAALSQAGGDHAVAARQLHERRNLRWQLPSTLNAGTIHP